MSTQGTREAGPKTRRTEGGRRLYLECACSSMHDLLRLAYSPPGDLDDGPMLFLDALWGRPEPWYRRLLTAASYVLRGVDCRFGGSMEHVFTPATAREAREILDEYIRNVDDVKLAR